MMKSHHSILSEVENRISAKEYLEFTVHLFDLGFFNSMVFCHDKGEFDRHRYTDVTIGFLNLLGYLNSCGVILDTVSEEPSDLVKELYKQIMTDAVSLDIICYELQEADFSGLDTSTAIIPENCTEDDFSLVKLFLVFRTGAALNKRAIENLIERKLTDSEVLTIRKSMETVTGRKVIKRKDNSYEMRERNEE